LTTAISPLRLDICWSVHQILALSLGIRFPQFGRAKNELQGLKLEHCIFHQSVHKSYGISCDTGAFCLGVEQLCPDNRLSSAIDHHFSISQAFLAYIVIACAATMQRGSLIKEFVTFITLEAIFFFCFATQCHATDYEAVLG